LDLSSITRQSISRNVLVYRSECQKESKWQLSLDQDDCGGLDRDMEIVFYNWGPASKHSVLGRVHTTLRELSLKNSIFPIEQKLKHSETQTTTGILVVSGKTAQFSHQPVPPKGFTVELNINGYPDSCSLWVAIRAQSYYSDKYSIVFEATMHHGELRVNHEFELAKYGGFDRIFSVEIYKLSQKNFKVSPLGQLLLTIRELTFIKSSGNSFYNVPNVYKNIRNRKWSKVQGVIEFVTVTPIPAERDYMAKK